MRTSREVENNIKSYLQEGLFKRGEYDYLTDFYLDNARRSLSTAEALFRLSENNKRVYCFIRRLIPFLSPTSVGLRPASRAS